MFDEYAMVPNSNTFSFARLMQQVGLFWEKPFLRFLFVGGINVVFSYLLYATFVLIDIDYRITLTICTVITTFFNFNTTGRLVFRNPKKRLFLKFVCVCGLIYVINQSALIILVTHGVGELRSQAMLLPFIVMISFTFNKFWVFRHKAVSISQ